MQLLPLILRIKEKIEQNKRKPCVPKLRTVTKTTGRIQNYQGKTRP